jgi:hypothetical protein
MCSCQAFASNIDWTDIGTLIVGSLVFAFGIIQWRANNKQSRQELRAYVSITDNNAVEVDQISIAGEPFDRINVSIGLTNTGQTPARMLIVRAPQLKSEVEDVNFPPLTARTDPATIPDLGKERTWDLLLVWTAPFRQAVPNTYRSGPTYHIIEAVLEYEDIFNQVHTTPISFRIVLDRIDTNTTFFRRLVWLDNGRRPT